MLFYAKESIYYEFDNFEPINSLIVSLESVCVYALDLCSLV